MLPRRHSAPLAHTKLSTRKLARFAQAGEGKCMGAFLGAFRSKRVFVMIGMGFASGLPLAMSGSTLGTWMTKAGVNLKTIGLFALVSLPYSFKFLWAPLLDRFSLPFLGRRRGWIALTQLGLALGIWATSTVDPRSCAGGHGSGSAGGRAFFGQPGHRERRLPHRRPARGRARLRHLDLRARLPHRHAHLREPARWRCRTTWRGRRYSRSWRCSCCP
jgi:hypothetical protein